MKKKEIPETITAFVVHAYKEPRSDRIFLVGRLNNRQTFAIIEDRLKKKFYIRESDLSKINPFKKEILAINHCSFRTMDKEQCREVVVNRSSDLKKMKQHLKTAGIRTYLADLSLVEQYFITSNLHQQVTIQGSSQPGREVDWIYHNPLLKNSQQSILLSTLSIDIETDIKTEAIRCISLAGKKLKTNQIWAKALLLSPLQNSGPIQCYKSEKELLISFAQLIKEFDPDIITGWNVIDFDFKIIARRFNHYRLPFLVGRSKEPAVFLDAYQKKKNKIIIPGRQVVDAMWLVRASPDRYPDYSLETVSSTLLKKSKDITVKGQAKTDQLDRLYQRDGLAFARYCLKDAELVQEILTVTGLIELTIKRCLLTGISLEQAWTSIPAFEHLYTEKLYQQSYVAPDSEVDQNLVQRSQGGLILPPQSGLFDWVLVFDFKSLYPSLIRTFNIDPLSFQGLSQNQVRTNQLIQAPNQALFSREPGILPRIIGQFFMNRENAKKQGDRIADYVYKILMNSFYGVLGARNCRFASSDLASAITSWGHMLLKWCQKKFIQMDCQVLYGDTDSLFVQSRAFAGLTLAQIKAKAGQYCALINQQLQELVRQNYQLESYLDLEFEKVYRKLFIPPIRSLETGAEHMPDSILAGRAKGYAGFIAQKEDDLQKWDPALIEVKGMEAVRTDWTDLAHQFQIDLLLYLFHQKNEQQIKSYILDIKHKLLSGQLDQQLIYRKSLRKPVAFYTKTKPPHVKAALLLDIKSQKGMIEYFITKDGPQPVAMLKSPLDYYHYIQKQLKPIALDFSQILNLDLASLFDADFQPSLFDE